MKIDELGRLLRSRRTAAGRTIASVAIEAGLSVPYVANLEHGRGNPTLGALASVARALGGTLRVELTELAEQSGRVEPAAPVPAAVAQFTRGPRFAEVATRVAAATGQPEARVREQLLTLLVGTAAVCGRFDELVGHRALDTVLLGSS